MIYLAEAWYIGGIACGLVMLVRGFWALANGE